VVLAVVLAVMSVSGAAAQESSAVPETTIVEAVVTGVLEEREVVGTGGEVHPYQLLEMRLTEGPHARETVIVEHGQFSQVNVPPYSVGDRLLLSEQVTGDGEVTYYVVDAVRRDALMLLAVVFAVLTIVVGKWRGAASLVGLAFSFLVIFFFVLPRITAGGDPIAITIAAAVIIVPVSFYISHGVNRKTTSAVVGTLIALVVTGIIARVATDAAQLTGFSSDEAMFLQAAAATPYNMRGLLMSSIIIGLLGVLDDVTVSQAAVVNQLRRVSPDMSIGESFSRAMDVGTDHIASLVNTLVLVYASTSLPLLLLFTSGSAPFAEVVNYEMVAEEIVRMLVASIGLILAVPVTTLVAGAMVAGDPAEANAQAHHH